MVLNAFKKGSKTVILLDKAQRNGFSTERVVGSGY